MSDIPQSVKQKVYQQAYAMIRQYPSTAEENARVWRGIELTLAVIESGTELGGESVWVG